MKLSYFHNNHVFSLPKYNHVYIEGLLYSLETMDLKDVVGMYSSFTSGLGSNSPPDG